MMATMRHDTDSTNTMWRSTHQLKVAAAVVCVSRLINKEVKVHFSVRIRFGSQQNPFAMGGLAQQMSGHVLCKSDRSFNSCNSYFGYEIRGHGYGGPINKEAFQEGKMARVLSLRKAVLIQKISLPMRKPEFENNEMSSNNVVRVINARGVIEL